MAELDLLASTPLDPSQVHIFFGTDAGEGSHYDVVKSKTLKTALEALGQIGGGNVVMFVADGGKKIAVDRPSMNSVRPNSAGRFRRRHVFAALNEP